MTEFTLPWVQFGPRRCTYTVRFNGQEVKSLEAYRVEGVWLYKAGISRQLRFFNARLQRFATVIMQDGWTISRSFSDEA